MKLSSCSFDPSGSFSRVVFVEHISVRACLGRTRKEDRSAAWLRKLTTLSMGWGGQVSRNHSRPHVRIEQMLGGGGELKMIDTLPTDSTTTYIPDTYCLSSLSRPFAQCGSLTSDIGEACYLAIDLEGGGGR